MVAAVICPSCRPGIFGGDPVHHPGQKVGHTTPGVLGGWYCACDCVSQSESASRGEEPTPDDGPIGPQGDVDLP